MDFDDRLHVPKYVQLKEIIRAAIESREIMPGEQLWSRSELTKKYSVSDITARKAIDELTAEGFIYKMQGKGTFVSERKPRPLTIGLIISHLYTQDTVGRGYLDESHMARVVHYVETEVKKAGGNIILFLDNDSIQEERKNIYNAIERRMDGLIIFYIGADENADCLADVQKAGIPLVLYDRYADNIETSFVTSDNFLGAYQATKALLARGVGSAFHITNAEDSSPTRGRMSGFTRALKEANMPVDGTAFATQSISNSADIRTQACEITSRLLASANKPIGIFAVNSAALSGAWECVQEQSIARDRVVFACFDQPDPSIPQEMVVASVIQPLEQMAQSCVKIITDHIDGDKQIKRIVLEPHLMVPALV